MLNNDRKVENKPHAHTHTQKHMQRRLNNKQVRLE